MSDKKLRVGVIGLGFGSNHVVSYREIKECKVVAVADNAEEIKGYGKSVEQYAVENGIPRAYRDGVEMIQSEDLDLVSLAVTPKYRESLLVAAAEKRISVVMEKPPGTNAKHAKHFAKIAQDAGIKLMIKFPYRFTPPIVKLKELIDSGSLGKPIVAHVERNIPWLPPAEDSVWDANNQNGIVNDLLCHSIDTLCFLLGRPISVYASGKNYLTSTNFPDTLIMVIRFENGAVASLLGGGTGIKAFKIPAYLSLYTENGQARVTGINHIYTTLEWGNRTDEQLKNFSILLPPRPHNPLFALRHFVECIRENKEPTCTIEDGIRAEKVLDGVFQSLDTNAVISID